MRADRTVIVIGAFLFAVGLAVAWNGYGYVQIERGWTQAISGTFAACTGLVLIALGLVLRELEAIASSASRATLLLAKGRAGGAAETLSTPLPAPPYAPPLEEFEQPAAQTVAEAPPPPKPSEPRQDSALSWMVRGGPTETPPEPKMPQAQASDAWLRHPLAERIEELTQTPLAPEPELALEPAPEPELPLESFDTPAPAPLPEPAAEIFPEPESEGVLTPEPEGEREPQTQPVERPAPDLDPELPPESPHEATVETTPEAPHETATAEPVPNDEPRPAVIGHYEAQGAHYTLYADGSIEAESSHGVYRFSSMAELKIFIEGGA